MAPTGGVEGGRTFELLGLAARGKDVLLQPHNRFLPLFDDTHELSIAQCSHHLQQVVDRSGGGGERTAGGETERGGVEMGWSLAENGPARRQQR